MLTGGAPVGGSLASKIAGEVYRGLTSAGFFERDIRYSPATLVSSSPFISQQ